MRSRDAALEVARKSPRVARLLASTILAAARIELQIGISSAEADSLAHDYLPTDAVRKIRENRERRELRDLPPEYRDRGVVTRTILEGVTRTSERQLQGGQRGVWSGLWAWQKRRLVGFRTWSAAKRIETDLREHAASDERAAKERSEHASGHSGLIDGFASQIDYGVECLQLRQEYAGRLGEIGLNEKVLEEAVALLDHMIHYHLTLLVG